MNDPNKRINVNLSSLLSLKAELLRKHEEVNKAKVNNSINDFIPKKKSVSVSNTIEDHNNKVSKKITTANDNNNVIEYEDSELFEKSKRILEAKSKYYDKMISSGGTLNSDDNCLIMFNQKKQEQKVSPDSSDKSNDGNEIDSDNSDYYESKCEDDDWVEYTDCLGRTRKCLKKDLEFIKQKDIELSVKSREKNNKTPPAPTWYTDTTGDINNTLTTHNVYPKMNIETSKIDEMRQNWEIQEQENMKRDYVHYQDILFDEARDHGVGYYGFSTDETERAKQQKELDAIRQKTLEAQQQTEQKRIARDNALAARVKAAKQRQRARLGLPPLAEDEPKIEMDDELYDNTEEIKSKMHQEKLQRKKEKTERLLEKQRQKHIRPWDIGKNNSSVNNNSDNTSDIDDDNNKVAKEWLYKPEKEPLTQQQWNERKREERITEFAPSQSLLVNHNVRTEQNNIFDKSGNIIEADIENRSLKFTTKKKKEFKSRNVQIYHDSIAGPITNELLNNELHNNQEQNPIKRKGAEIAPPSTFEYYQSETKQTKRNKTSQNINLESSIEAGLKFLRDQSDKGTHSTKSKWTSNADY